MLKCIYVIVTKTDRFKSEQISSFYEIRIQRIWFCVCGLLKERRKLFQAISWPLSDMDNIDLIFISSSNKIGSVFHEILSFWVNPFDPFDPVKFVT